MPAPVPASGQRPVTSTASSTTTSRPAPSRFVDHTKANNLRSIGAFEEVDAMEQAVVAEKEQSPKKKGGIFIQNRGDAGSKEYRSKDGELSLRK